MPVNTLYIETDPTWFAVPGTRKVLNMASKASDHNDANLEWKMLSPVGPQVAHHVACIINNALYIHGGIDKVRSTTPLNKLHRMDLDSGLWQEVRAAGSPTMSHHASVVLQNRYIVLLGGWDGSKRVCRIHVFDVQENKWFECETSGFPAGAGLSSHTATVLADGRILIIGREGSARMQRKYGNAFLVKGSVESRKYTYSEYTIDIDSRSGHTTHIMGDKMVILGGRSDKSFEVHSFGRVHDPSPPLLSNISGHMGSLKPLPKPPCGRKHHVAIGGHGIVLLHGGETFDGRSRDPVPEVYVLKFKPQLCWFKLDNAPIGRAGHSLSAGQDKVVVHGGLGGRGVVYGDTYLLSFANKS